MIQFQCLPCGRKAIVWISTVYGSPDAFTSKCSELFGMAIAKILATNSVLISASTVPDMMAHVRKALVSVLYWQVSINLYTAVCDTAGMPDLTTVMCLEEIRLTNDCANQPTQDALKLFETKMTDRISNTCKSLCDSLKDAVSSAHKAVDSARAATAKLERNRWRRYK